LAHKLWNKATWDEVLFELFGKFHDETRLSRLTLGLARGQGQGL